MAIQVQGNGGTVAEVDGTTYRALRTTIRPSEYGSLGHYMVSAASQTIAAGMAGNSDIFQIRWTDSTRLCVIEEVTLEGMYQLTGFTAGAADFNLAIARNWSAAGSGGSQVVAAASANSSKLRTSMGTTLIQSAGDMRIATTGALTAGTRTVDSTRIGGYQKMILAAANTQVFDIVTLFHADAAGDHPIVLAQNEGIVVRATVPATGTWVFGIKVQWSELSSF